MAKNKTRTRKHRRLSKARIRTGTDAGVKHASPGGRTGRVKTKNLMGCGKGVVAKRKGKS